jgi:HSP20 family protein
MSYLPSVQNLKDLRDAFSDVFFKGFAMYPTYQLLEGGPQMRLELKEDAQVIRSERYYGSLARSFSLEESVDSSAASAKYENGILKLTLPKKPNGSHHLLKIA